MLNLILILVTALGVVGPVRAETKKQSADAKTDRVRANERGAYGVGTFYARPTRGRFDSGLLIPTDEMHLVVGNFQDDTKYSGNTIDVSTLSRDVFNQVEALDQSRHYLFDYFIRWPYQLIFTNTDHLVTGVRETPEPAEFEKSGLPTEFDVQNGRVGHFVRAATTNGRMVSVVRWSTFFLRRPICTFTLDQGGAKRVVEGHVANEMDFNIYSEQGCRYVESLLPFGLELKVHFSQNVVSIDGPDHTAHTIVVDRIPGLPRRPTGPGGSSPISQQILDDPQFQDGVRRLIDQYWSTHQPPAQP